MVRSSRDSERILLLMKKIGYSKLLETAACSEDYHSLLEDGIIVSKHIERTKG